MKITEIKISAFGKIRNVTVTPTDGVNIIYGSNEAGKTTIMAFIFGMLYGVGRGEKRRQYDPWAGGKMGGRLSFEHEGKSYVLERFFGVTKAADKIELWCINIGEKVTLPDKTEPGEYILGINAESFMNSVYITQAGVAVTGSNNEIHTKLLNLAASGDESVSCQEIDARLADAASGLRSKRANARIVAMEKERSDLLEKRAIIMGELVNADATREDITRLSRKKARLSKDVEILERESDAIEGVRRLTALDQLIERKRQLDEVCEKYDKMHEAMFEGDIKLDDELLDDSRALLDEYNSKSAVIESKEKQLEQLMQKTDGVDKSCLDDKAIIKKNQEHIASALSEFDELREVHSGLELKIKRERKKQKKQALSLQNILIVGAAAVLVLVLLGFLWNVCFILAGVALVAVGAYVFIQKRGSGFGTLPRDSIELKNVRIEMLSVNDSISDILSELKVRNIDELERKIEKISQVEEQLRTLYDSTEELMGELQTLRGEKQELYDKIEEKLSPFREGDSKVSAIQIIRGLDRAMKEYAALEADKREKQAAFDALLDGRDYDLLEIEAMELEEKYGAKKDRLAAIDYNQYKEERTAKTEELGEVTQALIRLETALELVDTGSQELTGIEDEIKQIGRKIEKLEFEYDAICLARDALKESFESMQKDFGPMLNYRASSILGELTGGKYNSVIVSDALVPSIDEKGSGGIRGCHSFSSGTIDQIYLALRLAVAGILTSEPMPVLLDEAFAQFDDERMQTALAYLAKENKSDMLGQIMLFTCHGRVVSAAERVGLGNSIVKL